MSHWYFLIGLPVYWSNGSAQWGDIRQIGPFKTRTQAEEFRNWVPGNVSPAWEVEE